jgi:hypothetical protein
MKCGLLASGGRAAFIRVNTVGVGMDIIHPDFIWISKHKTNPDIQF